MLALSQAMKQELMRLIGFHRKSAQRREEMRTIIIGFFVLALSIPLLFSKVEGGAVEITLLHTNNVTGHLFPCPS